MTLRIIPQRFSPHAQGLLRIAAALYCFVFLFFAAAGPGAFALDRE